MQEGDGETAAANAGTNANNADNTSTNNTNNSKKHPGSNHDQDHGHDVKKAKRPRLSRKQRRGNGANKRFDMSLYGQRHVALRIAYVGGKYHGFASQKDTVNTVEERLFEALEKTCLVVSRSQCDYTRGARTDKGVSAVGSVVSCRVRSKLKSGEGIIPPITTKSAVGAAAAVATTQATRQAPAASATTAAAQGTPAPAPTPAPASATTTTDSSSQAEPEELNYPKLLNRVLPDDIRCLAWAPVPTSFNARFDAAHRTYKYTFLRRGMDIHRIEDAGNRLVGEHDFRNFCKMDVINVSNFVRTILSFQVKKVGRVEVCGINEELYVVQIQGSAFLWHQIRYIMTVLFLVGQRKEEASVVDRLLNISQCSSKPIFPMADELPLLLYDCAYAGLNWRSDPESTGRVEDELTASITTSLLQVGLLGLMREAVVAQRQNEPDLIAQEASSSKPNNKDKNIDVSPGDEVHVPLLEREREKS